MAKGDTHYSEKIKGDNRNFDWDARFDCTDGYVGIQQYENGMVAERVLLSPTQADSLVKFIAEAKRLETKALVRRKAKAVRLPRTTRDKS